MSVTGASRSRLAAVDGLVGRSRVGIPGSQDPRHAPARKTGGWTSWASIIGWCAGGLPGRRTWVPRPLARTEGSPAMPGTGFAQARSRLLVPVEQIVEELNLFLRGRAGGRSARNHRPPRPTRLGAHQRPRLATHGCRARPPETRTMVGTRRHRHLRQALPPHPTDTTQLIDIHLDKIRLTATGFHPIKSVTETWRTQTRADARQAATALQRPVPRQRQHTPRPRPRQAVAPARGIVRIDAQPPHHDDPNRRRYLCTSCNIVIGRHHLRQHHACVRTPCCGVATRRACERRSGQP